MTPERLKQYRSLKAEIEELAEQIQMLESSDIVQGSDKEFPYIKHNFKVETAECDRTRELLRKELRLLKSEYHALNEFINNIADSETRRIFRYRYIEGLKGSYANVMGLPVHLVYQKLKELGAV